MKAVIFAGGVGTRLWPLSRKKSPKQFEKLIGNKSTLQLTVERLSPTFNPEDIFISTGTTYVDVVKKQLPHVPSQNIIAEPHKRDVGPAVALMSGMLAKRGFGDEPFVILWSDHLVKHQKTFNALLLWAEEVIKKEPSKIVFIGQKPRFASDNLGWIECGAVIEQKDGAKLQTFSGFKYKPDKNLAETYFTSGKHCWNLGYFVSTPHFLLSQFQRYAPQVYNLVHAITSTYETEEFESQLSTLYEQMPIINFDNALLEQLDKNNAYVIEADIGWSDVGAWEALKEALEDQRTDNVTTGQVMIEDSEDNLIYNYQDDKLIVAVDLDNVLIVNTDDVLLVAKKTSVSKIKSIVERFKGTEHEKLT